MVVNKVSKIRLSTISHISVFNLCFKIPIQDYIWLRRPNIWSKLSTSVRENAYLDTTGVRRMRRTQNEKLRTFQWDRGPVTRDGVGILDRILTIWCGDRDERGSPICGIGLQYSLPFLQPGAVDTDQGLGRIDLTNGRAPLAHRSRHHDRSP